MQQRLQPLDPLDKTFSFSLEMKRKYIKRAAYSAPQDFEGIGSPFHR